MKFGLISPQEYFYDLGIIQMLLLKLCSILRDLSEQLTLRVHVNSLHKHYNLISVFM